MLPIKVYYKTSSQFPPLLPSPILVLSLFLFVVPFFNISGKICRHSSSIDGMESWVSESTHRKKKVREFPVPSRDVTTKLSLGGNNDVITELFLPRGSLVSDIPAGDGKLVNLFYGG
jgi:hypothetical protein